MSKFRYTKGPKILVDFGNKILDEVEGVTIKPGSNIRVKRSIGGTLVEVTQSATGATITPFQIFATKKLVMGIWNGTYNITLYPGSIDETIPTNMFATINQTVASTQYVILTCESDGYRITSSTWSVTGTPPTPPAATADVPPSEFYIILGVIFYNATTSAIIIYQIIRTNLDAAPDIWTTTTRPTAGPYDLAAQNYYYWDISAA